MTCIAPDMYVTNMRRCLNDKWDYSNNMHAHIHLNLRRCIVACMCVRLVAFAKVYALKYYSLLCKLINVYNKSLFKVAYPKHTRSDEKVSGLML